MGRGDQALGNLLRQALDIGLPITVLGEIHFGTFNGTQPEKNQTILANFLSDSRVQILQIDEQTCKIYGEIATQLKRSAKQIQQNDIWIAALCKQYGLTLITNDAGFQNILGLDLIKF